jgi:hypothetical protein
MSVGKKREEHFQPFWVQNLEFYYCSFETFVANKKGGGYKSSTQRVSSLIAILSPKFDI